jgi:hypothetical protein
LIEKAISVVLNKLNPLIDTMVKFLSAEMIMVKVFQSDIWLLSIGTPPHHPKKNTTEANWRKKLEEV